MKGFYRSFTPLTCGPGSPVLTKFYSDMARTTLAFTLTFLSVGVAGLDIFLNVPSDTEMASANHQNQMHNSRHQKHASSRTSLPHETEPLHGMQRVPQPCISYLMHWGWCDCTCPAAENRRLGRRICVASCSVDSGGCQSKPRTRRWM